MKIIHCGNVPIPPACIKKHGGKVTHPGRWVLNHVIAQKRAGMDVEVVAMAHKAKKDFITEIEGVKVHFLRSFHPYRHLTFFAIDRFRMASYIRSLHPDIVHAHGTEDTYALAAIHSGLPFCVTAQGLYFQIIPTLPKPIPLSAKIFRISENWALKHTRYCIGKSEYVKTALEQQYPHLQVSLIPNTYQPELEHLSPRIRDNKIAFVGSITHRKGVHLIAKAIKSVINKVPDIELHIFGNAPEGQGSEYEKEQIASLRNTLGKKLILHGTVSSLHLFQNLDTCRILLAPSYEEMFGNQLIEALMCGAHAIVTEQTAMAENVRRFGNGTIVPQNNETALSDAIIKEFQHPYLPENADVAQTKICAYMSPSAVAKAHYSFYSTILQK